MTQTLLVVLITFALPFLSISVGSINLPYVAQYTVNLFIFVCLTFSLQIPYRDIYSLTDNSYLFSIRREVREGRGERDGEGVERGGQRGLRTEEV